MSFWGYRPYVPVAARRAQAAREASKLTKGGRKLAPVAIEGRKIAESFWGKAWCDNLERYSDFENRLPRGRTYVRNGSVIDLQISRGKVEALVSGSEIYRIGIDIAVTTPPRWQAIAADCAGAVGSLVELLQGRLSKHVMERVCRDGDGLFPAPKEIKMSCSCPDWASMCKHVAAALYGVGARLDHDPDLLFQLRGVQREDLIAKAGAGLPQANESARTLADDDMAALFGLEFEAPAPAGRPPKAAIVAVPAPARNSRPTPLAIPVVPPPAPAAKRKRRGRPPKAAVILLPAPAAAPKRRGRPPKAAVAAPPAPAPARRGRPRKAKATPTPSA